MIAIRLFADSLTRMLRLELPLNVSYPTVNAYLIRAPIPTLVDCGLNTPESISALSAGLAAEGLQLRDIRRVVITHPHVDHIGLAEFLAANGAEIWLSEAAADWMANLEDQRRRLSNLMVNLLSAHGFDKETRAMTQAFFRAIDGMYSEIPPGCMRSFRAGDTIEIDGRPWQVIDAPGHTHLQVCFFQPDSGDLFSADMLLPKTPVPLIESHPKDPDRREPGLPVLVESYAVFHALDVRRVFPGHGQPFSNHRALIENQLSRIEQRKAECLAMISSGTTRLPDLLAGMYVHLPPHERLGGLAMLVGYLDLLQREDKVRQVMQAGEYRYTEATTS